MNNELKMEIGNRIREARVARGLTQNQFAEKSNISSSYLSGIENGNREPKMHILYSICKGNDISADELLFGPKEEISLINYVYDNSSKLTLKDTKILIDYLKGIQLILSNRDSRDD